VAALAVTNEMPPEVIAIACFPGVSSERYLRFADIYEAIFACNECDRVLNS
jgi:hypothetical protein